MRVVLAGSEEGVKALIDGHLKIIGACFECGGCGVTLSNDPPDRNTNRLCPRCGPSQDALKKVGVKVYPHGPSWW